MAAKSTRLKRVGWGTGTWSPSSAALRALHEPAPPTSRPSHLPAIPVAQLPASGPLHAPLPSSGPPRSAGLSTSPFYASGFLVRENGGARLSRELKATLRGGALCVWHTARVRSPREDIALQMGLLRNNR